MRARHFPDTTKDPDSRVSPGFLVTASASPVMRASLTCTWPETTGPSAGICCPADSSTMSSRTSFSVRTSVTTPSRTTRTSRAERRVSLSITRLERSCCTMPMSVLATAMARNIMSP